MDPAQFGYSTLPLQHAPYDTISSSTLSGTNAGKVAFVTGAGQGIGAAIAEALAKSGADVAILDLKIGNLTKTKEACLQHNIKVADFACDVTDAEKIKEVIDKVEKELGPIDVLVNNAGIFDQRPFIMSTFDGFWKQIEVNFKAPLMLIHQILPRMRDRGSGCIINIASRSGTVDVPMTLGYVTSKAALIRATHTLQKEMELDGLDPAIHMYALHPGGVKSGMGGGEFSSWALKGDVTNIMVAGAASDVKDKYGDITDEEFFKDLFKDGPTLCGQTCAYLATGRGKELRGLFLGGYFDLGTFLVLC